jgi:hypothetical protein
MYNKKMSPNHAVKTLMPQLIARILRGSALDVPDWRHPQMHTPQIIAANIEPTKNHA